MNLASRQYEAIKLPWWLPLAETDRLGGGVLETPFREREREREGEVRRDRKGERNWGLTERMEPFSRPTGVGSAQTVIELKHQLVMRPPRLGGQPRPAGAPANHRSPSCCLFWLFASLIGLIADWLPASLRLFRQHHRNRNQGENQCCTCPHV